VPCFDGRNTKNFWARPIEGLTAMVDINRREVLKLIDTGVVPIPQAPADFDPAAVGTLRPAPTPLVTSLSHGADFAL
jgi:primary-amine oxidase